MQGQAVAPGVTRKFNTYAEAEVFKDAVNIFTGLFQEELAGTVVQLGHTIPEHTGYSVTVSVLRP